MGKRYRKLTLLHHPVATGLEIIAIGGTCGEVRFRRYIPRDISAAWAAHLKFNEVSNFTGFFRLPSRLALRTPNSPELINIAPTEISTYFKQNKQQQNDEKTDKTENEKRHFLSSRQA